MTTYDDFNLVAAPSRAATPEQQGAEKFAQQLAMRFNLLEPDAKEAAWTVTIDTDDQLWGWVERYCGIRIPRTAVCEHHVAPFDAFAYAYFARGNRCVWKASRGFGGKTVLLAALSFTEAITLRAHVNLLGGSLEQSQRVHEYMSGQGTTLPSAFWACARAPSQLLVTNPSAKKTQLSNGGYIKVLAASQRSVRGPHPQRLRGDEIDEMDQAIWDAAQGQPMEARGIAEQTVGSSTHQYTDGTMTRELDQAAERGWSVFEWCYKETMASDGFITAAMVERKRSTVPVAMFASEYDLQEPVPEGRAIDTASVDRMFDRSLGYILGKQSLQPHIFERPLWEAHRDWQEFTDDSHETVQLDDDRIERRLTKDGKRIQKVRDTVRALPEYAHVRYAMGTDWGKQRDHTVSVVVRADVHPMRVVAWLNMVRHPYPVMFEQVDALTELFSARAGHDKLGLGTVADDFVREGTRGINLLGKRRAKAFSGYIVSVEQGDYVSPYIDVLYRALKLVTTEDLYTERGHPPDAFIASVLCDHMTIEKALLI